MTESPFLTLYYLHSIGNYLQKIMKPRIDTSASILFPVALALFLSTFARVVSSSRGTSTPFRYSENELQACTQIDENQNGAIVSDSRSKSSSDSSCMKLYERFLEHYQKGEYFSGDSLSSSQSYARVALHKRQNSSICIREDLRFEGSRSCCRMAFIFLVIVSFSNCCLL